MNLLQTEDLVKGYPDQRLMQEAQNPSGEVPHFLLISEVQRRTDMRKRFEQSNAESPEGTVAEQILGGGQQGQQPPGPPGQVAPNMSNPLPTGPGIAPNPNQPPPPQDPNAAILPPGNGGMARGGIVRLAKGGTISVTIDGQPLEISTEGYGSDQAAFDAYINGTNQPVAQDGGNPYYDSPASDAPLGQGAMSVQFDPSGAMMSGTQALPEPQSSMGYNSTTPPTAAYQPPRNIPDPAPTEFGGEGYDVEGAINSAGAAASRATVGPFLADRPNAGQGAGAGATGSFGGEGLPPSNRWESFKNAITPDYRKRADFDPLITLGTTPRHDNPTAATPSPEASVDEFVGPPESAAGLPGVGYRPGRAVASGLWDSFKSGMGSLAETAANPTAGGSLNGAGGIDSFTSQDIDEAITNSEVKNAGIASALPAEGKEPIQKTGLTDVTKQGSTAQVGENAAYERLMDMVGKKGPEVPDFSDLIAEERRAAASQAMIQFGAGLANNDMAGGLERAGLAAAAGNKSARELDIQSRTADYAAKRADTDQDIDILGKAGTIEVAKARVEMDRKDREGINKNAILSFAGDRIGDLMDMYGKSNPMASPEEAKAYMVAAIRSMVPDPELRAQVLSTVQGKEVPSESQIQKLRDNPGQADVFDERFGAGSAEAILGNG